MGTFLLALAWTAAAQGAPSDEFERACLSWARQVDREFGDDDPLPDIDAHLDAEAFFSRVFQGVDRVEILLPGVREQVARDFTLGGFLWEAVRGGGHYRFVRLRLVEGRTRALFRLNPARGGFNYQEFLLEPRPGGGVRIVDFLPHLAGELLSRTTRRVWMEQLGARRDELDPLPAALRDEVRTAAAIGEFEAMAAGEGRTEEILRKFQELPEPARKDPKMLLSRFDLSRALGLQASAAALADFTSAFPDELAGPMRAIGLYAGAGRHEQVLEAIDRIEQVTGPDAFLESQRGEVRFQLRELDASEACFRKAAGLDPRYPPARWALLNVLLRKKDFSGTAAALRGLESDLGLRVADLSAKPLFAEFVKSAEHAAWAESRKPREDKAHDLSFRTVAQTGQKGSMVNMTWNDVSFTLSSAGTVLKQDRMRESASFIGEWEVLTSEGGRATRRAVRFEKAARLEEGRPMAYGFQGKTVTVAEDADGERTYTYDDGKPLEGEDLEGIHKALSHRDDGETGGDDVFAPPKSIKVGESWAPDPAALARRFGAEGVDQVKAKFTLVSVEPRGDAEFARMNGQVEMPMGKVGPIALERPASIRMSLEIVTRLDSGVEDTVVKASGRIQGDSAATVPGVEKATMKLEGAMGGRMVRKLHAKP